MEHHGDTCLTASRPSACALLPCAASRCSAKAAAAQPKPTVLRKLRRPISLWLIGASSTVTALHFCRMDPGPCDFSGFHPAGSKPIHSPATCRAATGPPPASRPGGVTINDYSTSPFPSPRKGTFTAGDATVLYRFGKSVGRQRRCHPEAKPNPGAPGRLPNRRLLPAAGQILHCVRSLP